MTTIQLRNQFTNTHTCVSNIFIDRYLAEANGEFVKVYLCLLRYAAGADNVISVSAIADSLNHTEKDILRALKYWEKCGILSLELDEQNQLTGLCLHDLTVSVTPSPVIRTSSQPALTDSIPTQAATVKAAAKTAAKSPVAADKPAPRKEYTLEEVAAFSCNDDIAELLFIIETYLKHPLNAGETNTVLYWFDGLKFSRELIEYLVEYCITNGHSSLRYMDKVALGWAENQINTIDKAKEEVSTRSKAYYSVMKAFGISGRNLAESENAFVSKWTKEYELDLELILEACKRTISATQKPSFEYADSILTKWHENHVHTLKDVRALDDKYAKTKRSNSERTATTSGTTTRKNKFNNFDQRVYDQSELEHLLLTTNVKK